MHTQLSRFSILNFNTGFLMSAIRCFNVAAICALAVWHGYVFQLNRALYEAEYIKAVTPQIQIQLQRITAASTDAYSKA